MSDERRSLAAKALVSCWVIAIVAGFFASLFMSVMAFQNDTPTSGVTLGGIAIGCAILCYRTFAARENLLSDWK
jgi:ABC-type enterobactin transport system permease subunit